MCPGLREDGFELIGRPPAVESCHPAYRSRPGNVINSHLIGRRVICAVLLRLKGRYGRHTPVIQDHDAPAGVVSYTIDENLRVHREGAITRDRQAVERPGGQRRRKQGRDGKAHVAGAGFRERPSESIILHNLEPVGLHVA